MYFSCIVDIQRRLAKPVHANTYVILYKYCPFMPAFLFEERAVWTPDGGKLALHDLVHQGGQVRALPHQINTVISFKLHEI